MAQVPALSFTCGRCNARLGGCKICRGTGRKQPLTLVPNTGRYFHQRLRKWYQPPSPTLRLVFKDGEAVERELR